MRMKRICRFLLSLAILSQNFCELPANAEKLTETCDFASFSEQVQGIMQAETDRALYTEIVYDPAAGTLSADGGSAQTACGGLYIGEDGMYVQTEDGGMRFTDAPEAYGYHASVNNGTVTLTNEFQTARLIVKAAGSIAHYGAVTAAEGYRDLHILQYETPAAAYQAYLQYQADKSVQYVQPSHCVTLDDAGTEPRSYMTWGADLIGTEDFAQTYLADQTLPEVVVAVIDTGINTAPPLFAGRILDGGINVSNSGDDTVKDDLYHGTHVTGTICELTPDNVKILPVKVFDNKGTASDEQIYLGILHALEQGADILNMSFGGLGVSPLEIEAMEIADAHNVICCAASGNNGDDAKYYYPGSIESCITVGAVKQTLERADFSNYGSLVDVTAPGVNILSYLAEGEQREQRNGTSMATPHVTACCALLRSYDPDMLPARAESLLHLNAMDLGDPGFDAEYGWGMVCMKDFRWDDGICKAPVFSKENGNFGAPQTVSLTTDTEGASIYYTTDGTVPDAENGILYTEPLTVSESTQILAVAVKDGYVSSVPAEAIYRIGGKDVADAWTVENGVLTKCRSVLTTVRIPETADGEPITAVAAGAFAGNHSIKRLTLPDSVTKIGDGAFENCSGLETVKAGGVTQIGARAFADDPELTEAVFADTVETVGEAAFSQCSALEQLALAGVRDVPAHLCEGCESLGKVMLPDAETFADSAFFGCAMLQELQVGWRNVTAIGSFAFANCPLWKGDLPLTALEILGTDAFNGDRSLLHVTLSEQITALPENTFAACSGLRLLRLPAVTAIGTWALAVSSTRSDLTAELDYSRITAVGENAFRGFRIGSGYDTVAFSALETVSPYSFSGALAGVLVFPLLTDIPANAFADAKIAGLVLESVKTIGAGGITGCKAVVLTDAVTDIAADAFVEDTWIVSLDEISVPDGALAYRTCAEPLILYTSQQNVQIPAHAHTECRVLACGVGLTYQWYRVTAEEQLPLAGETAAALSPDTAAEGVTDYLCIMTDAGGKTERYQFTVTVTAAEDAASPDAEGVYYGSGMDAQQFAVSVPESGSYHICASGAAPVTGFLTDAAGSVLAAFQISPAGISEMTADLDAGTDYYLTASGKWNGSFSIQMTQQDTESRLISDCRITVSEDLSAVYGEPYCPVVTVTAPDGTVLQEGSDYTVRAVQHNQICTAEVFGKGDYSGYAEASVSVYPRIPEDTPIPVSLSDSDDKAVYMFVPKKTGKYYFYATYGSGYAEEVQASNRSGYYPSGSRYAPIQTTCTVCSTPDGTGSVYAENSYSGPTGNFFNSNVTMNAGQPYYMICTAKQAAEYALVVSASERRELRGAVVRGNFYAVYTPGKTFVPNVTVTLDGETLTEGVDYQLIHTNTDKPGKASLTVVGMGIYTGKIEREYDIILNNPAVPETYTEEDTAVRVTCAGDRTETIWFRVDAGKTANETIRYRVINERISGGRMEYQLYEYAPLTRTTAAVSKMKNEQNDYKLKNGIYCLVVSRQYPDQACAADITVMQPFDLSQTELEISNTPYIGAETEVPLVVRMPDGRELEKNKDYKVVYPNDNTLFGTTPFQVIATNRSYNSNSGSFEIYVDLPEDAPELTLGEHEVHLTLDDRLAVYRLTPETDMHYVLSSTDVPNNVLRIFQPDGTMLEQVYGSGAKAIPFDIPAGETRYVMVKFNGTAREGTLRFQLDTETKLLNACKADAVPQVYTGAPTVPDVTFTDGDYQLVEGVDYELRYMTDEVNIGTATVNYVGKGRYFGSCDVTYRITADDLFSIPDLKAVPLTLGEVYTADGGSDTVYMLYRYTPGVQTMLNITVFDALCNLTLQLYDQDGSVLDSEAFRTEIEKNVELEAGETIYLLFSATNISSHNRSFKLILRDYAETGMELIEDAENGLYYRVSKELGYAEVYAIRKQSEQIVMKPEIEGLPVTFVPEGLFRQIPQDAVVIGYAGCNAAEYADQYHFLYLEAGNENAGTVTGDLNGDGRCSDADAVVYAAVLSESTLLDPALLHLETADLNADGILDFQDYAVLLALIES